MTVENNNQATPTLAELGWEPRGVEGFVADGGAAGGVFFGAAAGVAFREVVVGVRPGTGFSFKLLTFCAGTVPLVVAAAPGVLSLPTLGSFRARSVPVDSAKSSSKEIVSGRK